MDVAIRDLFNSKGAMVALKQIPFKATYGFKIKKSCKQADIELNIFDAQLKEHQAALFKDLPEGAKPAPDALNKFNSEIDELLDTVVSLDAEIANLSWFTKTNGAVNDDSEWHNFTPANFEALSWLIVDDVS